MAWRRHFVYDLAQQDCQTVPHERAMAIILAWKFNYPTVDG